MAAHAEATFWFVLPSLPMFLAIPWMLRSGVNFWAALAIGCAMTIALYLLMTLIGPKFGLRL
jgi:accessory gene regulator protein AgrB